MLQLYGTFNAV